MDLFTVALNVVLGLFKASKPGGPGEGGVRCPTGILLLAYMTKGIDPDSMVRVIEALKADEVLDENEEGVILTPKGVALAKDVEAAEIVEAAERAANHDPNLN